MFRRPRAPQKEKRGSTAELSEHDARVTPTLSLSFLSPALDGLVAESGWLMGDRDIGLMWCSKRKCQH